MEDIKLLIVIASLFMMLIGHLIGSIWWAATLTNRLGHVEKWIEANQNLHAEIRELKAKIDSVGGAIENFRRDINKVFDKLDAKADKP